MNWQILIGEIKHHFIENATFRFAVAQIFYRYFPSLLDIEKVNFEVGVTPKVRTRETADAFIRSLVELQIKGNISKEQEHNLVEGWFPAKPHSLY